MLSTKRTLGLVTFVVASASSQADLLWDQYTFTTITNSIQDQKLSDFPNSSLYAVNDVVVGSGGWHITSVSTLVSLGANLETWNANVTHAHLHIFNKSGALPIASNDPTASPLVSISTSVFGSERQIQAAGLNIDLNEGSYWIGLTPVAPSSLAIAYHFHTASNVGDPSAIRNPAGAFGFGTNWGTLALVQQPANDLTLRVNGTTLVPEPATLLVLGLGIGALVRRRQQGVERE